VLRRLATSCLLSPVGLGALGLVALVVPPAAARNRPHYGGTLHVEIAGDPWQRPNGLARRLVLDGLTTIDADGAVRPSLADEWESENSNHRWQFRLRPGVHFHDGTPLTSVVVVASLMESCPANCPWTAVRAAGSSIVFTGDAPMPSLPALLAADQFLISLTVSVDGKVRNGVTGTGPFQVNGFNNGTLSLIANDACWQGRPFVDSIEIRARRSVPDQRLDLSTGRADVVEVPAEELRQARQQHLTVLSSPPLQLLALQISDSGPLANPNLRAAIAQAIDRTALANVIYQKEGLVTASLLPQALSGYSFLFPAERDLNKAQQFRGGITPPPLSMRVEGDAAMQLAAQRIALNLREAGFNVQLNAPASLHADLALISVPLLTADPAAMLEEVFRNQHQPSTFDSDPLSQYKAERDFLDRKNLIPLLHLPLAYAISPRVRDLQLRSDGAPDLANASLEASP
jgi:peptide/nickel transport system substrate-binding protein